MSASFLAAAEQRTATARRDSRKTPSASNAPRPTPAQQQERGLFRNSLEAAYDDFADADRTNMAARANIATREAALTSREAALQRRKEELLAQIALQKAAAAGALPPPPKPPPGSFHIEYEVDDGPSDVS